MDTTHGFPKAMWVVHRQLAPRPLRVVFAALFAVAGRLVRWIL